MTRETLILMEGGWSMVPEGWVFLTEVGMDYEADIIVGLLEDNGLSAAKHFPGAGEYLKLAYGMASGVQIYVPKEQIEEGKALLQEGFLSEGSAASEGTLNPDGNEGSGEEGTFGKDKTKLSPEGEKAGLLTLFAVLVLLTFVIWVFWQGSAFFSH